MKIIIALELIPFAKVDSRWDCASEIAERLEKAGHSAHIIRLPFPRETETDLVQSFLSTRLLSLQNADRLLVIDPFMAALQHTFKISWLFGGEPALQSNGKGVANFSNDFEKEIEALMVADCQRFVLDNLPDTNRLAKSVKRQDKPTHAVSRSHSQTITEEDWEKIIQFIAA